MMKFRKKKWLALALSLAMVASLAGCGSGDGETNASAEDEYVYVPEYHEIPAADENTYYNSFTLSNGKLYYSSNSYDTETGASTTSIYKKDMANIDAEAESVFTIAASSEGASENISYFKVDDQDVLTIVSNTSPVWTEEMTDTEYQNQVAYYITKYDATGTELGRFDISEQIKKDPDNSYIQYVLIDKDGNIYISNGNSFIYVYKEDGSFLCEIPMDSNSYISGMGALKDGRIGILMQGNTAGMVMRTIDLTTRAFSTEAYTGLPDNAWNSTVKPGLNADALIYTSDGLYDYSVTDQSSEELLVWLDCDMTGDYVQDVDVLEDGRIIVITRDWNTDTTEIVLMTKAKASEVRTQTVLTFATFYLSQETQASIVAFNKANPDYRIKVKDYSNEIDNTNEDYTAAYSDALTKMNNDIISGNTPDLIDTTSINVEQLNSKGLIEDLNTYLESSTVINREDMIESVLNAYTYEDRLVAIPTSFYIMTMLGKASEFGGKTGWNVEEMLDYAESHPDMQMFQYANKASILSNLVLNSIDDYIDYETGACSFDTDAFKRVLEYTKDFPDEIDYNEDSYVSTPVMLREGTLSLMQTSIDEVTSWQMYKLLFGESITPIGYPSADKNGNTIQGSNTIAISSKSEHKDGAWAFLEGVLAEKAKPVEDGERGMYSWGFPIFKEALEAKFTQAMTPDTYTDENGNEIEQPKTTWGYDGEEFEIYAATQEDIDEVRALIDSCAGASSNDTELLTIIQEEAAPYFAGQKTVDEVTQIIQSRIQIYVDENR